jgi:chromosome segregation protein
MTGAQTLLGITMEESGVSKVISTRLENTGHTGSSAGALSQDGLVHDSKDEEPPQQELWGQGFEEEDVEVEEGRQLPPGVDDPAKVSDQELRPIRSGRL